MDFLDINIELKKNNAFLCDEILTKPTLLPFE